MTMRKITLFLLLVFSLAVQARRHTDITVLQWNVWQEGTSVKGGYEAIVDEIVRLKPDFVMLSEVRNYNNRPFSRRLESSLAEKGLTYYSFTSYDTGLLSLHPIEDSTVVLGWKASEDAGSVHRLTATVRGKRVAVYTAHLDYRHCAYYDVRGYDGSTWERREPVTDVQEVLRLNTAGRRDEGIAAFLEQAARDEAEGRTVLLGGDFNEPSHLDWTEATRHLYDHQGMVVPWTCSRMLYEAGYTDAWREVWPDELRHPGITYPSANPDVAVDRLTWAPLSDERERIDFIYYKGKARPLEARVFGPDSSIAYGKNLPDPGLDAYILPRGVWPTDHKGVWVKFRLY